MAKKEDLWFCAKRYGWGWTPCSWQGWLVTILFILLIFSTRWFYEQMVLEVWEREVLFVVTVAGHVFMLIGICMKKGERPRWRWGSD